MQAGLVDDGSIQVLLLEVPCQFLTAMCLYGKRINFGMSCVRTVVLPTQEPLGARTICDYGSYMMISEVLSIAVTRLVRSRLGRVWVHLVNPSEIKQYRKSFGPHPLLKEELFLS